MCSIWVQPCHFHFRFDWKFYVFLHGLVKENFCSFFFEYEDMIISAVDFCLDSLLKLGINNFGQFEVKIGRYPFSLLTVSCSLPCIPICGSTCLLNQKEKEDCDCLMSNVFFPYLCF